MLLILAETSPETGIFSLQNAFALASLTCSKNEVIFAFGDGKDISSLFRGKGFRFLEHSEPRRLFKENISAILFFKDKLSKSDKKILSRAKKKGIPTVKFSYMGKNSVDCDLIIDPSPVSYNHAEAKGKIMSGCGFRILHNKYIHFHKTERKYKKKIRHILIAAGDQYPYRELRKLTEALIDQNYRVKIIPGKNFKRFNYKTLKRLYPGLKISQAPESYARSYYETDLAIVDPEFSAAEAASTGTPAIYIPQSGNGEHTASYFEEQGAGLIFRRRKQGDYSEIIELMKFFTPENRENFGNKGKSLADGKGIYRIAEALRSLLVT